MDFSRVKNRMRKAQNGGELTIGFLGGSITQGSLASNIRKLLKALSENSCHGRLIRPSYC